MKFIIHVIDEVSKFVLKKDEFLVEKAVSENGELCDIQRSDAFYHIEAEDATKAIIIIAQKIKIIDEENNSVSLAYKISENYKKMQNSEVDISNPNSLDTVNYVFSNTTHSNLTIAVCRIEKCSEDESGFSEKWIENHKIFFYTIPVNKILDI